MKMTEREAKTKVCPQMSFHREGYGVILCRGSECALWRWGDNTGPEDISWREHHGVEKIEPKGFCGLSN